jgi:hypothetical protein
MSDAEPRDTPPCEAWTPPSGCGWPPTAPTPEPPDWQALVDEAWQSACDSVWALTGRRMGRCQVTAAFSMGYQQSCLPVPFNWQGQWFNVYGYPTWPQCEVNLRSPLGAVVSVDSVMVDGQPFDHWMLDGDRLVNLDLAWPTDWWCSPRHLVVQWTAGDPPPTLCLQAAAALAREVIAPCLGQPCQLPGNITTVTRQGITVTLGDPTLLLQAGLTGIPLLDLAIRTFNPSRLETRSRVYSPDVPRPEWRRPPGQPVYGAP